MCIQIEGDMTIYEVAELKEEVLAQVFRESTIELDLSSVTRVDSSGIQLLLLFQQELNRMDIEWKFSNLCSDVLKAIDIYNLGDHLLQEA